MGTRCLYNNILASNLKLSRRWWNRCHLPHASAGPARWETSDPIKTIRDYEMPSYDAGRSGFPLQDTFHLKMITLRQELHLFLKQNVLLGFLHCLSLTLVTFGIIICTIPKHIPHLPLVSQTSRTHSLIQKITDESANWQSFFFLTASTITDETKRCTMTSIIQFGLKPFLYNLNTIIVLFRINLYILSFHFYLVIFVLFFFNVFSFNSFFISVLVAVISVQLN